MMEALSPRHLLVPRPASNVRRPPGRFTIQEQRAEVLSLSTLPRARPLSGRRPPPGGFTLQGRKTVDTIHKTLQAPTRFPGGDRAPAASSSVSGERSNRSPHHRGCALVSSEARSLIGSLSILGYEPPSPG
jgi:hypothetical protein